MRRDMPRCSMEGRDARSIGQYQRTAALSWEFTPSQDRTQIHCAQARGAGAKQMFKGEALGLQAMYGAHVTTGVVLEALGCMCAAASCQPLTIFTWLADTHTFRIPRVYHHGPLSSVPGGGIRPDAPVVITLSLHNNLRTSTVRITRPEIKTANADQCQAQGKPSA